MPSGALAGAAKAGRNPSAGRTQRRDTLELHGPRTTSKRRFMAFLVAFAGFWAVSFGCFENRGPHGAVRGEHARGALLYEHVEPAHGGGRWPGLCELGRWQALLAT